MIIFLAAPAFGGGPVKYPAGGSGQIKYQAGGTGQIKLSIGLSEPINFAFSGSSSDTLTATWSAPPQLTPAPTNYSMQVSTNQFFTPTVVTTDTVGFTATGRGLLVNRTYYGRVRATTNGFDPSSYSGVRSTATLAVVPVTVASTWTMVGISSLTAAWTNGDNPSAITQYDANLSTVSGFGSGTTMSSSTYNLNATFTGLSQGTTYYARVRAVNQSGIPTNYLDLGSTKTAVQSNFFTDNFTDTNGVDLNAHTSDSGHTWTFATYTGYTGTAEVQSNAAVSVTGGNPIALTTASPGSADYEVTMTVTSSGYSCGPVGRADDTANDAYLAYWEGGGALRWTLNKIVAGTESTLANSYTSDAPTTAKVVKLSMIGTTIKLYIEGVERYSVTDSGVSAAGTAGVVMAGGSETCDTMTATVP